MGRISATIQVDGKQCRTLFASGPRNTYITAGAAEGLPRTHLPVPRAAGLGGKVRQIREGCYLVGTLEGKAIEVDAYVLDEIGPDDDGRPIDILFGALAMQKWGIRLLPQEERLDLSRYPEEFTEFAEVVFGQEGDLEILGARTLEGLNLVVDPTRKKLVAGGPVPAAAIRGA